jgi:hypothetical protein
LLRQVFPKAGDRFADAFFSYFRYNFLPKALLEQCRRISNLYFIIVCCCWWLFAVCNIDQTAALSLIPGLSPNLPVTSILPVVFILGVAMIKEAVEDLVDEAAAGVSACAH